MLDLNRNAANQLCHRVRARFAGAFGARMLWGDGRPRCVALQAELAAAGVDRFGTDAVPLISRHVDECLTCGEDRRSRLSPAALFVSIPLVPALLSVRAGVAHGLAANGVPMQGSTVAPNAPQRRRSDAPLDGRDARRRATVVGPARRGDRRVLGERGPVLASSRLRRGRHRGRHRAGHGVPAHAQRRRVSTSSRGRPRLDDGGRCTPLASRFGDHDARPRVGDEPARCAVPTPHGSGHGSHEPNGPDHLAARAHHDPSTGDGGPVRGPHPTRRSLRSMPWPAGRC